MPRHEIHTRKHHVASVECLELARQVAHGIANDKGELVYIDNGAKCETIYPAPKLIGGRDVAAA